MTFYPINKPTEPGWYWFVARDGVREVCRVDEDACGEMSCPRRTGGHVVAVRCGDLLGQWYGPKIEPPNPHAHTVNVMANQLNNDTTKWDVNRMGDTTDLPRTAAACALRMLELATSHGLPVIVNDFTRKVFEQGVQVLIEETKSRFVDAAPAEPIELVPPTLTVAKYNDAKTGDVPRRFRWRALPPSDLPDGTVGFGIYRPGRSRPWVTFGHHHSEGWGEEVGDHDSIEGVYEITEWLDPEPER